MDIQSEVQSVKKELVELIIKHLQEKKLDLATSSKLARDFLSILPIQDQEDLLSKLKTLGTHYQEAQTVYNNEEKKLYDNKKDAALAQITDHIKQGNIEHAITIAKSI